MAVETRRRAPRFVACLVVVLVQFGIFELGLRTWGSSEAAPAFQGLFTDDPKKNSAATHIPNIGAKELLKRDLADLIVERVVVEYLTRAKYCTELQFINGLERGMITRALEGEDVGTIVYKD